MTTRALRIVGQFKRLTQYGTAHKVCRQAKRSGIKNVQAGQRIHYAEHFLKNPIKHLLGRPEMKTKLISNFKYAVGIGLGNIKKRARMTEAVAVQGAHFTDDKVVASACIDPSGNYANGQINSGGIGNKEYMNHMPVQQDFTESVMDSPSPESQAAEQPEIAA